MQSIHVLLHQAKALFSRRTIGDAVRETPIARRVTEREAPRGAARHGGARWDRLVALLRDLYEVSLDPKDRARGWLACRRIRSRDPSSFL
jgi:hypothetical protein